MNTTYVVIDIVSIITQGMTLLIIIYLVGIMQQVKEIVKDIKNKY